MDHHFPAVPRRRVSRAAVLLLALAIVALAVLAPAGPAQAASRGSGFGTWAPVSAYGWHGSMLVGGVHTYCILPGEAAPTGTTTDRGVRTDVLGLSPTQLAGVNLLVTKYGQTADPVRAAAVSWAVKAIADRDAALHAYGYRGDSLAGAINWTFSSLAPQHNTAVQELAVAYYREAKEVRVPTAPKGELAFTTDPADHRRGTVTVRSDAPSATGSLTLTGATFVKTGTAKLTKAVPGVAYAIRTTPAAPGRAYRVSGEGRFTVGVAAAVRHFTTPGGQDTAGPAGGIVFTVKGKDAAPRAAGFVPAVTTEVGAPYAASGPFVDDVTPTVLEGEWPRDEGGLFLPLVASATVYRTDEPPVDAAGPPEGAVPVGTLVLTTDPHVGPDGAYRVVSDWSIDAAGFYTAVWTITAGAQPDAAALRLPPDYVWQERFGVTSQITMAPAVRSHAQKRADLGDTVSDTIIVEGPVPPGGLTVTSALHRAQDGTAPADSCTDTTLVWASPPQSLAAPGEATVTSPAVTEPGTYYWQERAVDADGTLVHLGRCGVEEETSVVAAPAPAPTPTPEPTPEVIPTPTAPPPPAAPPAEAPPLAETGPPAGATRTAGGIAIVLLTIGAALLARPKRPRFEAPPGIG